MPTSSGGNGLLLVSAPRNGRRPASFWRFPDAPPPGTGKAPVLAIAGLGLDGRVFARLGPLAADRDLVLVNLPNETPRGARMEDFAEEALGALDAAGHAGRRAVILGSSFGGMVALAAALARPERTAALVLVGTGASWGTVRGAYRLVRPLQAIVPRRAYPSVFAFVMLPPSRYPDPETRAGLRTQMLHRTKGFVGACIGAMRGYDATGRLGEVRAPALVIHGEGDRVFHPRHGEALSRGIPGATLLRIPSCGHLPQVSHPRPTVEGLRRFLAEAGL